MKKSQCGITMMEVLITLLVLGILAVATVPYIADYLVQLRAQSAGEALYHDFQKARSEAIQQGQAVTVVFQTGSNWCYGATTAATCDCSAAASCNLGQTSYTAYDNTTLSIMGFTTAPTTGDTTFNASRGDVNRIGTATFTTSGGDFITVELNKMGFPEICGSGLGGYQSCT